MAKLTFPRVKRVVLRHFSLYSSQQIITEQIISGVFCLAGANGLGKSTFLAAVSFGITGVADPERKFESVDEYYAESLEFSGRYFSGRINENDRELAEVSIELDVGSRQYQITRGMFEPSQLRSLAISDSSGEPIIALADSSHMTPTERHQTYAVRLVQDVGLGSFPQLVFLHQFVLTFDERRHLLFWDPKVLEQALHLAFGTDIVSAKRADTLRREAEKADSRARNANWQASEIRKKIGDLQKLGTKNNDELEDLADTHRALTLKNDAQQSQVESLDNELRDTNLRIADLSVQQHTARADYALEFSQRIKRQATLIHHPLIATSIADERCGLCGTEGSDIASSIRGRFENADRCPICGSQVGRERLDSKSINRLREIDTNLSLLQDKLEQDVKGRERISSEISRARDLLSKTQQSLDEFETANAEILSRLRTVADTSAGINAILEEYRRQMQQFLNKKKDEYALRDDKRKELRKVQLELAKSYSEAEGQFVPLFKELAFRFLGLDLDIRLDTAAGINLVLDVRGTARRQYHQLSESQRFFVDIALRMALVQYMSNQDGKACLFVDTPEGSLDIAYESRAGDMFALFVGNGYHLIMTANINSSQLLRSLAEKCGRKSMQLVRMTSWTELSEVQIEEEELFEKAYSGIEAALRQGKK